MAAEQPAVQPDVGDQERAVESHERALPMPGPGKAQAIPDGLVSARGAMQARHLGRRPRIVVKVEPGEALVFPFAERRDRHTPAGPQLLAVEGLEGKERQAIVQRHQDAAPGMTPSTERTR